MESSSAALASAIGARVREQRQLRKWTLDHLADVAGVSRRMLINVEQGTANPSVGTLLRISDALGVGLPALVEPPANRPVTVTRAGEGAALWSSATGGRGVLVAGTRAPDVLELWEWTMFPGDRHDSEAHAAGTHELLQVHQGCLALRVGEDSLSLGEGDAVAFPGDVPHGYATSGRGRVRFVLAVFEPGVGVASGAR